MTDSYTPMDEWFDVISIDDVKYLPKADTVLIEATTPGDQTIRIEFPSEYLTDLVLRLHDVEKDVDRAALT